MTARSKSERERHSYSDWKGRRVLVTGGTGFVGSHLVRSLLGLKAEVTLLVRDIHPRPFRLVLEEFVGAGNVVLGDVSTPEILDRTLRQYEIDTCFHLAAQAIVGRALDAPNTSLETNIQGTWNVLEACRKARTVERIVVASSDKAYGEPLFVPITEKHPLLGRYPYDASKACADIISQSYFTTYGLPIGITRCSNIYGSGDLNFSRLIPGIIRDILMQRSPIIRSDGSPIRDYMYVSDAVNAYLLLAENLDRKVVKGEAFNFGTGRPTSVRELVDEISEASRSRCHPQFLGKERSFIQRQYLSSEKARKALGWRAEIGLSTGIRHTLKWYTRVWLRSELTSAEAR